MTFDNLENDRRFTLRVHLSIGSGSGSAPTPGSPCRSYDTFPANISPNVCPAPVGVTSFALYTYNGALNWMQVPIGPSEQSEIESGDERRVQLEPGTHLPGCQLALVDTGYVVQVVHG